MKFLSSVLFFTILCVIFLTVSILGTLFPKWNVYHTYWFYGLLSLISINILFCLLQRIFPIIKKKIRSVDYLLIHISFFLIFIGGMSKAKGFDYSADVNEGDSIKLSNTQFTLKLKRFRIDYYEGRRMPKSYNSDVVLFDENGDSISYLIRVNHPLSYKGITIYQMYYGERKTEGEIIFGIRHWASGIRHQGLGTGHLALGTRTDTVKIPFKELNRIEEKEFYNLRIEKFISDTVNLKQNAVIIKMANKKTKQLSIGDSLIFPYKRSLYKLYFKGIEHPTYSGFEVAKDPGAPMVAAGAVIFLVGIFLSLFWRKEKGL